MAADNPAGLEALYHAYRPDLARFLTARTGDAAEAEDLLQELWLKLRAQPSGPITNGRAYLYRMAQNLVVDRVRESRRRMVRDRQWSDQHTDFAPARTEVPDPGRDAQQTMQDAEETALLASAIANLPDGAQRTFKLHKIDGLSHEEVAARLGISKSGVEKHMAVAMKYLRRALLD